MINFTKFHIVPLVLFTKLQKQKVLCVFFEQLSSLYQKIYLGDICARNNIKNDRVLNILIKKMAESSRDADSLLIGRGFFWPIVGWALLFYIIGTIVTAER